MDYRWQRETEAQVERDPELRVYTKSPRLYAEGARFVALTMRVHDKPCRGGVDCWGEQGTTECDEGRPCARHSRVQEIVARYRRRFGK